jgi:hypothetical protein
MKRTDVTSRSFHQICNDLVEGIKGVYKEMDEKGLLKEDTTFEEAAHYAGQHVLLTEMSEEEYAKKMGEQKGSGGTTRTTRGKA